MAENEKDLEMSLREIMTYWGEIFMNINMKKQFGRYLICLKRVFGQPSKTILGHNILVLASYPLLETGSEIIFSEAFHTVSHNLLNLVNNLKMIVFDLREREEVTM